MMRGLVQELPSAILHEQELVATRLHLLHAYLSYAAGEVNLIEDTISMVENKILKQGKSILDTIMNSAREAKEKVVGLRRGLVSRSQAWDIDLLYAVVGLAEFALSRKRGQLPYAKVCVQALRALETDGHMSMERWGEETTWTFLIRRMLTRIQFYALSSVRKLEEEDTVTTEEVRSLALKFVPVCQPGDEWVCLEMIRDVVLKDYPALYSVYTKVMVTRKLSENLQAIEVRDSLSCQALLTYDPANDESESFLPLPYQWILLPLISYGLEPGVIYQCLRLIDSTSSTTKGEQASYMSMVPAPLLLHYLVCLFLSGDTITEDHQILPLYTQLFNTTLARCGEGFEQQYIRLMGAVEMPSQKAQSITEFVDELVQKFTEEGGASRIAWVLRTYLRTGMIHVYEYFQLRYCFQVFPFSFFLTGFPAEARARIWRELGGLGLMHRLVTDDADMSPIHPYLVPHDTDAELLDLYVKALTNRGATFDFERGGTMLLIAIHHLSSFFVGGSPEGLYARLLTRKRRLEEIVLKGSSSCIFALLAYPGVLEGCDIMTIAANELLGRLRAEAQKLEEEPEHSLSPVGCEVVRVLRKDDRIGSTLVTKCPGVCRGKSEQ